MAFKKKQQKIWIFKAYDRYGKRLIDWEFGDRSHATLLRLFNRLKEWDVLFYAADHRSGFGKIIPKNNLFQGKVKMFRIEQNNSRQRHWFARLRRKTLVNS